MSGTDAGEPNAPASFDAYAAARDDAAFTDWLRARAEPDWTAVVTHPLARDLCSGDLDDEAFRRYLVQDYAVVETLVGAFGRAIGAAPTMDAKSSLAEFVAVLTDDYFERAFAALGVADSERAAPDLTPTTRAFEDLLERAGREGGYPETLAVLVPAEWVYFEWAAAADGDPDRFYLAEWVDLHATDAFAEFVAWLRRELDREGAAASPRRRRRLDRLFRRTTELEAAFFTAAFDEEATPTEGGRRW